MGSMMLNENLVEHVIYALHSGDGNFRYVGVTRRPARRLYEHRDEAARRRTRSGVYNWIRKIGAENLQMSVVDTAHTAQSAFAAEAAWISLLRESGFQLLNHTDGGEGLSGASEETRRRMSESGKGRVVTEGTRQKIRDFWREHGHPRSGAILSRETRSAISRANTGRKGPPMSDANKAAARSRMLGKLNPNYGKSPSAESTAKRMKSLGDTNKCIGAQAKLSWADVEEIRSSDLPASELADRYGVHKTSIKRILNNETWKIK